MSLSISVNMIQKTGTNPLSFERSMNMKNEQWCEITGKDWDKLSEYSREIFLTPIPGSEKNSLTYAGRKDVIEASGITAIRDINC